MKKDISIYNKEKQEFIEQIQGLQNELNKCIENASNENNNNDKKNEEIKSIDNKETGDIESIKNENANLKNQIETLNQNIKDLNQELDAYEKEAIESEQEVNMLKENNKNLLIIRDQLMKEIDNFKINTNTNEIKEENKIPENKILNKATLFMQKLKNFSDKIIFKNKIKLYIDMISTQRMEHLIIENAKLNHEKSELSQKVEILTELINNPESISKYIDENGNININIQYENENENGEEMDNNGNINNIEGEEGQNNMENNGQK